MRELFTLPDFLLSFYSNFANAQALNDDKVDQQRQQLFMMK